MFGQFYEALYSADASVGVDLLGASSWCEVNVREILGSIHVVLKEMKKNKTCAKDGLVAEMLLETIVVLFSDLISGCAEPPEQWRRAKLVVLFKNGT